MFCSTRPWLPDDDQELFLLADADSLEQWKENRAAVLAKFYPEVVDGNPVLGHKRILADWDDIMGHVNQRREAGARGGQERVKRLQASAKRDQATANQAANQTGNQTGERDQPNESKVNKSKEDLSSEDELALSPDPVLPLIAPALTEVWNHYLTATNRNPKLNTFTSTRKKKGLVRLQECLDKAGGNLPNATSLMKLAIDKLAASDFHMGRDPKTNGVKYNSWEDNVFRSLEQMEAWWQK